MVRVLLLGGRHGAHVRVEIGKDVLDVGLGGATGSRSLAEMLAEREDRAAAAGAEVDDARRFEASEEGMEDGCDDLGGGGEDVEPDEEEKELRCQITKKGLAIQVHNTEQKYTNTA